jgi:hypothetical protein
MISEETHQRIGSVILLLGGLLILLSMFKLLTLIQSFPQSLDNSVAVTNATYYFIFGIAFLVVGFLKQRRGRLAHETSMQTDHETTIRQSIRYLATLLGAVSLVGPTITATVSSSTGEAVVEAEAGTTALAGGERTMSVLSLLAPDNMGFLLKTTVLNSPLSVISNLPKFFLTGLPAIITGSVATVFGVVLTPLNTYYGFGGLLGGVLFLLYGLKFGADASVQFEIGFLCLLGATGLTYLHYGEYI